MIMIEGARGSDGTPPIACAQNRRTVDRAPPANRQVQRMIARPIFECADRVPADRQ
jgi:hypothetical protein